MVLVQTVERVSRGQLDTNSEKERKDQGLPRRGSWVSLGERGVLRTAGTGVDV